MQGVKNFKDTLCWHCDRACKGGCSWVDEFIPVDGWTATPDTNCNGVDSYCVEDCPEFIPESRLKLEDMDNEGAVDLVERLLEITRDDYKKSEIGGRVEAEIEQFIRGRGARRITGIVNPERVIMDLKKARIEYRKKKAQMIMV